MLLFVLVSTVTLVYAPIDLTTKTPDYTVYSSTGGAFQFGSGQSGIYKIGTWLYAFGGYNDEGRRWYASNDNGLNWTVGSNYITTCSGIQTPEQTEMADTYYDTVNNRLHQFWAIRNSGGTGKLNYSYATAAAGWVTMSTPVNLSNNVTAGYTALTCFPNGYPVIVAVWQSYGGSVYWCGVWFGTKATPGLSTDFAAVISPVSTLTGVNGYYEPSVHVINSTAVIVFLEKIGTTDLRLFAVEASSSTFGTAAPVSTYDVEGDTNKDANNYYWLTASTVSDNTFNTSLAVNEVLLAYISSTQCLYAELYNVTGGSLSESLLVQNFSTAVKPPKWVCTAKANDTYWIGVQNYTSYVLSVSANFSFLMYERDYIAENWSSAYTVRENLKTTYDTCFPPQFISRTTIDNSRLFVFREYNQSGDPEVMYSFGAYGLEPYVPGFWEGFSFPFSLILGLTGVGMVFGGSLGTIHYIKDREWKGSFNAFVIALVGMALVLGWFFV